MYQQCREMIAEAKAAGLAVGGLVVPARHRASARRARRRLDVVAYAAQIAAQLGAHVIKVKPPTAHIEQAEAKKVYEKAGVPMSTLAERVRHVVQSSFDGRRIVIFSGGATKDDDEPLFDEYRGIRDGGGFGSIIGRNSLPAEARARAAVPRHRDEDLLGRAEVARAVAVVPTEAQVREYLKTLSNWGRWGAEDELGTMNLITPAKRVRAARLVTDGVSVSCARPIATDITADTTVQPMRFMVDSGEGRDTVSPERRLQRRGRLRVHRHGLPRLHDHPRRRAVPLLLGRQAVQRALVQPGDLARGRAPWTSVEVLRDGVVSRGVLLDVARTRGVAWLRVRRRRDAGGSRGRREGRRACAWSPGDILLVRTGYYGRRLKEGAGATRCRPARPRSTPRAARGCASAAWR